MPRVHIDFDSLPRCGAKTRAGTPCKRPGRKSNGRCRLHGGATPIKHGRYSKASVAKRRQVRATVRELRLWERNPEAWARAHGIDVDALLAEDGDA
jgi:hypothetical protein